VIATFASALCLISISGCAWKFWSEFSRRMRIYYIVCGLFCFGIFIFDIIYFIL
jgi:hypothetical protein